jgi:hypothetical protein
MRSFKSLCFIAALLFLVLSLAWSGTTYDQTVDPVDRIGKLYYSGTVTFTDSASGAIYYTQAMYIGAVNASYGWGTFQCSEKGTEDVNVFIEYSNNRSTWVAGTTDSDLDAVGTTLVEDTIGVANGADILKHKTFMWMRYKFVAGQAIGSTTMSWGTSFIKPSGIENVRVGLVYDKL